jgi:hypothetical protein
MATVVVNVSLLRADGNLNLTLRLLLYQAMYIEVA